MQVSNDGLAFVAAREALCLTAHKDTRLPAIGFGVNDPTLTLGETITIEEAIDRYLKKAPDYDADVLAVFKDIPLAQHQFDALWSLDWNTGRTDLRRATDLVTAIKSFALAPDTTDQDKVLKRWLRDRAAFQFTQVKYDSETDTYFNLSRRMLEGALFASGNYGDISRVKFYGAGKHPKPVTIDGVFYPADTFEWMPMPVFR